MVLEKLSLRKNMTWTLVGTVIYSFTQWLLLIVIAKLGTPEMVGQYALGLAITAPIVMLTDMRLRMSLVTDAKMEFGFEHYLGTRLLAVGLSFIMFVVAVWFFDYSYITSWIIVLIGLTKLPESISDILHGLLQKNERMDYITFSSILKGVLTVITFSIILYYSQSLVLAIVGQLVVWTFILLFYDGIVLRKYGSLRPSFEWLKVKQLVKLTIPLGIMGLLTSLNTNIPSYLVEYFLGKEELGYFVAILYIVLAGNRVANSLRQPAAPLLAVLYEEKNTTGYKKLLFSLCGIGLLMGGIGVLVALFIGKYILSIIYTSSYAEYSGLFVLIMLSGLFNFPAMFLGTGIIATRHFKSQPYLAALWVIVSLVGCFIFVPIYGVSGAAIALILSSLIKLISLLLVLVIILKKERSPVMESNIVKEVTS